MRNGFLADPEGSGYRELEMGEVDRIITGSSRGSEGILTRSTIQPQRLFCWWALVRAYSL